MLHFIKINVKIKHKKQHPKSIIKVIVLMMNSYISSKATKNKILLSAICSILYLLHIFFARKNRIQRKFCEIFKDEIFIQDFFYLKEKGVLNAFFTIPVALQP